MSIDENIKLYLRPFVCLLFNGGLPIVCQEVVLSNRNKKLTSINANFQPTSWKFGRPFFLKFTVTMANRLGLVRPKICTFDKLSRT